METTVEGALALGTVLLGLYAASERKVTAAKSERAEALAKIRAAARERGIPESELEDMLAGIEETESVPVPMMPKAPAKDVSAEQLVGLAPQKAAGPAIPYIIPPVPAMQQSIAYPAMMPMYGASREQTKAKKVKAAKAEGAVGTMASPPSVVAKKSLSKKKAELAAMEASGEVVNSPSASRTSKDAIRKAEKLADQLGVKQTAVITETAKSSTKAAVKAAKARVKKKANAEEKKTGIPTTGIVEKPAKGEAHKVGKSVYVKVDCRGGMKRVSARSLGY